MDGKAPEGVNEIKAYAFYCCIKLEEATIPASVTSLGEFVFSECFSLKKITVDSNNSTYSSDNRGVLFNKDKICCPFIHITPELQRRTALCVSSASLYSIILSNPFFPMIKRP